MSASCAGEANTAAQSRRASCHHAVPVLWENQGRVHPWSLCAGVSKASWARQVLRCLRWRTCYLGRLRREANCIGIRWPALVCSPAPTWNFPMPTLLQLGKCSPLALGICNESLFFGFCYLAHFSLEKKHKHFHATSNTIIRSLHIVQHETAVSKTLIRI